MEIPKWTLAVNEYKHSFHIIMFHKDRDRDRQTDTTDRDWDWLTDWLNFIKQG